MMSSNLPAAPVDSDVPVLMLEDTSPSTCSDAGPPREIIIDSSYNDEYNAGHNIILQTCPEAADMFCDSLNAIADILSLERDDDAQDLAAATVVTAHNHNAAPSSSDVDQQTTSPRSVLEHQHRSATATTTRHSICVTTTPPLTPNNEGCCQRRGRFLVWPASLSSPSLGLPDTRSA